MIGEVAHTLAISYNHTPKQPENQDTCKVFRGIGQKNGWNDVTIRTMGVFSFFHRSYRCDYHGLCSCPDPKIVLYPEKNSNIVDF